MRKIGLKLWSCNTGNYLYEAEKLHDEGMYEYIELYIVPETMDTVHAWQRLKIPFILHNAHFQHGFNLAKKDCERHNQRIYRQTAIFADALKAETIIFHCGVDGEPCETARQLASFKEKRAIVENKPFIALPNKMGGFYCRGSTTEELDLIIGETGCGFCLDFGHAVCSAVSQTIEPYAFIAELVRLAPAMFHLSDVHDMNSPYDAHPHLGAGELDLEKIIKEFIPENGIVSLETNKDSAENLDDFRRDAYIFRKISSNAVIIT